MVTMSNCQIHRPSHFYVHGMNFTKRRGTTKRKIAIRNFGELKMSFLEEIVDVVTMENIPPQLIMNWDQTAIKLVPCFP